MQREKPRSGGGCVRSRTRLYERRRRTDATGEVRLSGCGERRVVKNGNGAAKAELKITVRKPALANLECVKYF